MQSMTTREGLLNLTPLVAATTRARPGRLPFPTTLVVVSARIVIMLVLLAGAIVRRHSAQASFSGRRARHGAGQSRRQRLDAHRRARSIRTPTRPSPRATQDGPFP
jgi:hypothetical protein